MGDCVCSVWVLCEWERERETERERGRGRAIGKVGAFKKSKKKLRKTLNEQIIRIDQLKKSFSIWVSILSQKMTKNKEE